LQTVVHHIGSVHRGHLIVFVRGTADEWYRYNDANVTAVSANNVLTSGAYILSYAKRCGAGVG
ncbi:unnamed protein product, partial [Laminaria digitata]